MIKNRPNPKKSDTLFRGIVMSLLITVMSGTSAFMFAYQYRETAGQRPVVGEVQAVTFTQGNAFATVKTPSEAIRTVRVTNLNYSQIAALANRQEALAIIQTNGGEWEVYQPGLPYVFLVLGILSQIAAILFSMTSLPAIKRPLWRLCMPLGVLLMMWSIACAWEATHWSLALLALPLALTWAILKHRAVRPTEHKKTLPRPLSRWKSALVGFVTSGAFIAIAAFLQGYPLRLANETLATLTTCKTVTLRPHLAITHTHSSRGYTRYVLASYLDAEQRPHYVELSDGSALLSNNPLLTSDCRRTAQKRFRRLYKMHPVEASLSPESEQIILCDARPQDHLLNNETLGSLHVTHAMRLMGILFWIFGLIIFGNALLLFAPNPTERPLVANRSLTSHGLQFTLKWIALPATLLFTFWQWQTCYGRFANLPRYSLLILLLPLFLIAGLWFIAKRRATTNATAC